MPNVRLATESDLPRLEALYAAIVADLHRIGIPMWDDVYPATLLPDDVARGELHVVEADGAIVAAFVLRSVSEGPADAPWERPEAPAAYLGRLGVDPRRKGTGIGSFAVNEARAIARSRKAAYLRLFVVDANDPARRLYERLGFTQVGDVLEDVIAPGFTLRERAFEIPTA